MIAIKDREMPKSCVGCKLWTMQIIGGKGYDICRASDKVVNAPYSKPDWCPLIEVREPHGRLIDADALMGRIKHDTPLSSTFEKIVRRYIENAPTVIPASEEG